MRLSLSKGGLSSSVWLTHTAGQLLLAAGRRPSSPLPGASIYILTQQRKQGGAVSLVTVNHRHFIMLCVCIGHFTVTAVEPNYPLGKGGKEGSSVPLGSMQVA